MNDSIQAPTRIKAQLLWISVAVVVLDQWTKHWIEGALTPHSSRSIIPGFLQLTLVENPGVAFGFLGSLGQAGTWALVLLGGLALGAVGLFYYRTPSDQRRLLIALALVLGGAVGNLIDRVFAGAVTDFVDVYVGSHHWPAFNVADSAISVAVVLVLIDAFRPALRPGTETTAPVPPGA